MNLTALPARMVDIQVMGLTRYAVWCSELDCIVFDSDDAYVAGDFLAQLVNALKTGMSAKQAVAFVWSVV